jgi:hypothetical protein
MSKLGISKTQLLSDPKIKLLYEQYMKQKGKGKLKGLGLWDSFVDFLKRSKVISNVGGVLAPLATGTIGGILGTSVGGPAGTVAGSAAGAAVGKSAIDYVKSLGFGKRKRMLMGGDSRLTISPIGTRLGQKGMKKMKIRGGAMTVAYNGQFQHVPGTPAGYGISKQKGMGTTAFNTVSSQFGNIKT